MTPPRHFKGRRIFPLFRDCDMMQRSIMVPVPARNNSSSCCTKGRGDRVWTGTRNALVIEIPPWSEKDVGKPGRQEHAVVDGPSDGQPLPCHNGIGSLFYGHPFCLLSHRFVLQQVFHVRNEPTVVLKDILGAHTWQEGLRGRVSCHFLMVDQKDWRRSMNSFNLFLPSSSISTNSIPAS